MNPTLPPDSHRPRRTASILPVVGGLVLGLGSAAALVMLDIVDRSEYVTLAAAVGAGLILGVLVSRVSQRSVVAPAEAAAEPRRAGNSIPAVADTAAHAEHAAAAGLHDALAEALSPPVTAEPEVAASVAPEPVVVATEPEGVPAPEVTAPVPAEPIVVATEPEAVPAPEVTAPVPAEPIVVATEPELVAQTVAAAAPANEVEPQLVSVGAPTGGSAMAVAGPAAPTAGAAPVPAVVNDVKPEPAPQPEPELPEPAPVAEAVAASQPVPPSEADLLEAQLAEALNAAAAALDTM